MIRSTVLLMVLAFVPAVYSGEDHPGQRLALLVGCTQYTNSSELPSLWGPANDVELLRQTLKAQFQFADADITTLVGWPEKETQRPTARNIVKAFDELIDKTKPDSQIVILLSGHGSQIPELQDKSGQLHEEDGLDEIFLAADFRVGKDGQFQHFIRDNQINDWLTRLRHKGAHVWVIFDCCHSGTMDRNRKTTSVVKSRGVSPLDLGFSKIDWLTAIGKAKQRVRKSGKGNREIGSLHLPQNPNRKGSVVAFYAAQAYEKTFELPQPKSAPALAENYYGLLTYALVQAFKQQKKAINYGELGRTLVSHYRSQRGGTTPTPFYHGDLNRQVLGKKTWPRAPLILEQVMNESRIPGGRLAGLSEDTILSVHPPAGARNKESVLGYVKVVETTAAHATVRGCPYADKAAVDVATLPNLAICKIVQQELGDMRLSIRLELGTTEQRTLVKNQLSGLPRSIKNVLNVTDKQADWHLRIVTPKEARDGFGLTCQDTSVLLLRAEEWAIQRDVVQPRRQKIYGNYSLSGKNWANLLGNDLKKIFVWQNLWRVTGQGNGDSHALELNLLRLAKVRDPSGGKPLQSTQLHPGQILQIRMKNNALEDYWITLLYMDAHFGIDIWAQGALAKQAERKPLTFGLSDTSFGPEGIIVIALPRKQYDQPPDFDFLKQQPLGVQTIERATAPPAKTPFERILRTATFGQGTRSWQMESPTNPQILSWSWTTVPGK